MLETTSCGETIPHRFLWRIVEEQASLAEELERGWLNPTLVAMVFASHTVEAYLNFVGERLAPKIWQDERSFFTKEPYRGWNGKLHKVMELVRLPQSESVKRQLDTVLELKKLRDLIAHPKPEKLKSKTVHDENTLAPFLVSTLVSMITPKEKLPRVVYDVEELLNQIHSLAAPMVNDPWFGEKALRGTEQHSLGTTICIGEIR